MLKLLYGGLCVAFCMAAATPHALERAASLPYDFETDRPRLDCAPGEFVTSTLSGGFACTSVVPPCSATEYVAVSGHTLTCKSLTKVCPAGQALNAVVNGVFSCAPVTP